ncbi:unnamed protein product, partial [marine sediment metagenome]
TDMALVKTSVGKIEKWMYLVGSTVFVSLILTVLSLIIQ